MALFKVSIKQSGLYNGCKVEKGMEVEVSFDRGSNNLTGSIQRSRDYYSSLPTKVWTEHQAHHGSLEYLSGH